MWGTINECERQWRGNEKRMSMERLQVRRVVIEGRRWERERRVEGDRGITRNECPWKGKRYP